ncbi:hypothetical protein PTSG_08327 [Salpingoeca rosetta]|uniref:Uncharacterized protein n=1 Tax=Salpingoeca rosetta (strain ATCC 50818 / BSB-021) TaxID=946362 RepID=F2UJD5_SALR5|nr:uncharacterized protein PTSG_08327 [Salpingoeca rosetta]EGD77234.1 hypothetical protein PTSG_08327 [Salpingoeca rosetta]|eukprot:XP_004990578.1 hypothetical protein PTSG_08327 [Salpingoeca rosetta]
MMLMLGTATARSSARQSSSTILAALARRSSSTSTSTAAPATAAPSSARATAPASSSACVPTSSSATSPATAPTATNTTTAPVSHRRAFSNKTRPVLGAWSSSRPARASRLARSQLAPGSVSASAASSSAAIGASNSSATTAPAANGSSPGQPAPRGPSPLKINTRFDHSILHGSNEEWDAVIFDKDGTLVDQTRVYAEWTSVIGYHFEQHCGADAKNKLFDLLRVDPSTGQVSGDGILAMRPWKEIYDSVSLELSRETGMKYHEASSTVCAWRADLDLAAHQTPLFDVQALFSTLKDHGTKVAIVTADDRDVTTLVLADLGVLHLVDALVTGSDMFAPKPQAEAADHIVHKLQLRRNKCAVVGDTLADLLLARNANLGLGVAVLSGACTRDQLSNYTDVIIDRADELPRLLYPSSAPAAPIVSHDTAPEQPTTTSEQAQAASAAAAAAAAIVTPWPTATCA